MGGARERVPRGGAADDCSRYELFPVFVTSKPDAGLGQAEYGPWANQTEALRAFKERDPKHSDGSC